MPTARRSLLKVAGDVVPPHWLVLVSWTQGVDSLHLALWHLAAKIPADMSILAHPQVKSSGPSCPLRCETKSVRRY
jgi:hypothetical protein